MNSLENIRDAGKNDFIVNKQIIPISETVIDGVYEQGIECDVILPDYCPDVIKLLKCIGKPVITSYDIMGDKLNIEGTVTVSIYYSSERMSSSAEQAEEQPVNTLIRCFEHKHGFKKAIDLKSAVNRPNVTIYPVIDYINCRPVSKRRLDIRGAVSIKVRVSTQKDTEVVSQCEGMGIQLKRKMLPVSNLVDCYNKSFTIKEDMELGHDKPIIGTIIRHWCRSSISDYKIIPGKIVLKGEIQMHILYQPQDEKLAPQAMDYFLPISQIVDMESVDEDNICDIRLRVINCEITPKYGSEDSGIEISATLCVDVKVYKTQQITVVEDCYSTLYNTGNTLKNVNLNSIDNSLILNEIFQYKNTIELPETDITQGEILDMWFNISATEAKHEQNKLTIFGKLTICMFTLDEQNCPVYFDKTIDMQFDKEMDCENGIMSVTDVEMEPVSMSYSLLDKLQMEIRCDIRVCATIMCSCKQPVICDITVDSSLEKSRQNRPLILYFADAGETVWGIAKEYGCSCDMLMGENNLTSDTIENRAMLMLSCI